MDDRTRVHDEASEAPVPLPVRAVLVAGLVLGVAGDVLLRGPGGPGLNVFLLFVGLGVAVWGLSRRGRLTLSREAIVTMGLGVALAATLVLRGSEALRGNRAPWKARALRLHRPRLGLRLRGAARGGEPR